MALYLGGDKLKINLDGIVYRLNLYSENPITNGSILLSSDKYILKDCKGVYLTAMQDNVLLSIDNDILIDKDGLCLILKEDR